MTTHPRATSHPGRDRLDSVLAALVWALVLATAAIEATLLEPVIPRHGVNMADKIDFYVSALLFQALWIVCLLSERRHRHHRRRVRFLRRIGLIDQGCFLVLLGFGTWPSRHLYNIGAGAFFLALAMALWHARASSEALHPDDQKIVDQIAEEQDQLLAQHIRDEAARLREARLAEALAGIRRFPIEDPSPEQAPVQTPNVKWDIPKGRHTPVVYFIRNGNRFKIGTTTDLHQRVRRLSLRFDDVALVLPGGRDVERTMHRQFGSIRVGTSEWFRDAAPLSDFIATQVHQLTTTSTKGSDSHE